MNTLKSFVRFAKFFAFTLSLLMFCFPTVAMANTCTNPELVVHPKAFKQITINGGSFDFTTPVGCLEEKEAIRSVTVSLVPPTATGTIDEIVITGPGGKREFGCEPKQVKQGAEVIQACGGPAILEAGDVQYHAKGHGFGAEPVELEVGFSPNFK